MNITTNPTATASLLDTEPASIAQREATQVGSPKSAKVQKAIKDFEGVFMSMMIKELRQTDSEDGLFPGDASDTFGGMFDMFMGNELAAGKGIGMESLFRSSNVIRQLEAGTDLNNSLNGSQNASPNRSGKAIQGYRNEQFRSGAVALP
ncbi:MAG: hypothetical protein O2856_04145 [Planctomycetota bacterium]|nr:hypothetical protein [Planctomycetota bacterium]